MTPEQIAEPISKLTRADLPELTIAERMRIANFLRVFYNIATVVRDRPETTDATEINAIISQG